MKEVLKGHIVHAPALGQLEIIEDGFLNRENLQKAGKDDLWLRSALETRHTDTAGTFLLTVEKGGKVNWIGKEEKT